MSPTRNCMLSNRVRSFNKIVIYRSFRHFSQQKLQKPITQTIIKQVPKKLHSLNIHEQQNNRKVGIWLLTCSGLVFGMVIIGGLTRLTRSGLSMTEWKFQGSLPPFTAKDWKIEFEKYKKYPEFSNNSSMTIQDFKNIYKWEYTHRMYGRLIGCAFALPFAYFIYRGYIHRSLFLKLGSLLILGTTQGVIGWWMVKSGLNSDGNQTYNNLTKVSPYRLATHLAIAFTLYCGLLYTGMFAYAQSPKQMQIITHALQLKKMSANGNSVPMNMRRTAFAVSVLSFCTAIMGAFVAGNEAGMIYDSWPKMGNHFIPRDDLVNIHIQPLWRNAFENSTMVQFIHRNMAYLTVLSSSMMFAYGYRLYCANRIASNVLFMCGCVCGVSYFQALLGVCTLLYHVPISLASCHQTGSMTLLGCSIWLLFLCRRGGYGAVNHNIMFQLLQKGKLSFLIV